MRSFILALPASMAHESPRTTKLTIAPATRSRSMRSSESRSEKWRWLSADKSYDDADFVEERCTMNVAAARGAEYQPTMRLRDRPANHPSPRLRGEPAYLRADRRGIRLDQDCRWPA
jgi:hypothetical protein